jgi:hypothetical protein
MKFSCILSVLRNEYRILPSTYRFYKYLNQAYT